jgi:hypothetical protein
MTNLEDVLPELMRRSLPDVDVEIEPIVAGAVVTGRRRRRRHHIARTAQVGLAAAAVVALGVGVATVTSSPAHRQPAAASSLRPSPGMTAVADPLPSAAQLVAKLPGLLPKAGAVSGLRTLHPSDGSVAVGLNYNDGRGSSAISVVVTPTPGTLPKAGVGDWACGDPDCVVVTQADGSVLMTDPIKGGDGSTYRQWQAWLGRSDGTKIGVIEFNSAQLKGATATRPEPPLTIAQLATIVNALNG